MNPDKKDAMRSARHLERLGILIVIPGEIAGKSPEQVGFVFLRRTIPNDPVLDCTDPKAVRHMERRMGIRRGWLKKRIALLVSRGVPIPGFVGEEENAAVNEMLPCPRTDLVWERLSMEDRTRIAEAVASKCPGIREEESEGKGLDGPMDTGFKLMVVLAAAREMGIEKISDGEDEYTLDSSIDLLLAE